jgi:HSP20 family protein
MGSYTKPQKQKLTASPDHRHAFTELPLALQPTTLPTHIQLDLLVLKIEVSSISRKRSGTHFKVHYFKKKQQSPETSPYITDIPLTNMIIPLLALLTLPFLQSSLATQTQPESAMEMKENIEKVEEPNPPTAVEWPHFSSLFHPHDWPFMHHPSFHFPSALQPSNFFSGLTHPATHSSSNQLQKWNLHTPMDIKETDKTYEVTVEMPGIQKEEINVSVKNHIMTISAEKKSEERKDGEKYHRVERFYGQTSRSFTLPPHVHKEDVKASYTNGVLHLTIPKKEGTCGDEVKVEIL